MGSGLFSYDKLLDAPIFVFETGYQYDYTLIRQLPLSETIDVFCSLSFPNTYCISPSLPTLPLSLNPQQKLSLPNTMGSATSSIPAEPIVTVAAVAGALGYGYVHYFRPAAQSGDEDAYSDTSVGAFKATSTLRGQKKRGRKLQLPGDATLKNLDILDAPVPGALSVSTSASKTRERQRQTPPPQQQQQHQREAPAAHVPSRDVVPGGFDGTVTSVDDARDTQQSQSQPPLELQQVQQQQQHVSVGATKKPKKKKGKKVAAVTGSSDPSSASAVGASPSLATGASAAAAEDVQDERWTRVEARKKKVTVPPRDGLADLQSAEGTAADVTTSDAGVTTSVTGNSSPVTERTTEDELRSEPDECVIFITLPRFLSQISDWLISFVQKCAGDSGCTTVHCTRAPATRREARERIYVAGL